MTPRREDHMAAAIGFLLLAFWVLSTAQAKGIVSPSPLTACAMLVIIAAVGAIAWRLR